MHVRQTRGCVPIALALLVCAAAPTFAAAGQTPSQAPTPAAAERRDGSRLGVEGFGTAGITWPSAEESFEAVGLDSRPLEFGGGARVTGLWRSLFAQVAVSQWSDTGERTFVDSTGTSFPLGIPLNVKARYLDVSVGWKSVVQNSRGRITAWPYIGAGAGVVSYSETSPFAESGDDLDTRSGSYHVLMGVEFPILSWLAGAVDARYRFVPDLLGTEGVSAALEEDVLGGVQVTAGLRVGFGGGGPYRPPARTAPAPEPQPEPAAPSGRVIAGTGVIIEAAPAYLLPDPKRTPLRTLPQGTTVRILQDAGDWVQVEFSDPQYGPRVGYVQRKFVQFR